MRPELEEFLGKVLSYVDQVGTPQQQRDVTQIAIGMAKSANELEDFEMGVKDPKLHLHHDPEELRLMIIRSRRTLGRVCRKIVDSNKNIV